MMSGAARKAQQTDPRKCRVTFKGLANRWNPIWDGNPRIAKLDEKGDFQELVARGMDNMRPYHLAKTAERWTYNLDFRPDVGEIYFTDAERSFGARYAGRIVIEPHIKPGASPNKQWGMDRWQALARLMKQSGLKVTQLGPPGTALLDGAEFIHTATFRLAAAVLAGARAAVLPEGGTAHAAAAVGLRSVVIFGNFTPVELTGYPGNANIGASLRDACGNRLPCPCCAKAMAAITPEKVCSELLSILERKTTIAA